MSSGQPTTWFSGKSAPEDQPQGPPLSLMVGAALLVYSPLGVLVTAGLYVAFVFHKVTYKVIAAIAGAYVVPYLLFVLIFSSPAQTIAAYHAPFLRFFKAATGGGLGSFLSDNWWFWLSSQLPLSLAIGLTVAAVATTYKWIRRPAWENHEIKPGMMAKRRRKKAIEEIASDVNGPDDGRTLGVTPDGKKIVQSSAEMSAHGLIAGGSGAGKTTTALIGIRDAIRRGEPVGIVDLKGSQDLPEKVGEWCERYGRRFLHWSIVDSRVGYHGPADGPAFYDPIGRGDPSRKKDLLIGAEKWDMEYYKGVNEFYAQVAFQVAELDPRPEVDAFTDLASLLDHDNLKQRALNVFLRADKDEYATQLAATQGAEVQWWTLTEHVTDPYTADVLITAARACLKPVETERSAVSNLSARVQKLRMSTAGHWLKRDTSGAGRDINLREVADRGDVVVFSLDSSNYEATSAQIGGLIIQDLKTLSAELRVKPAPHPFHILLDEFSAIGSENIIGLLARARDARMPTMLSTQALGDLRKVDDTFLDQVLGIINYFILHRANAEEDAEIFAGLTGKKNVYKVRTGVETASGFPGGMGTGAATGQANIEQVEDYVVLPSDIQKLEPGEIVYIANAPKKRVVYPLAVIREDPNMVAHAFATGAKAPVAGTRTAPTEYVPEPTHEMGYDTTYETSHEHGEPSHPASAPDWMRDAQANPTAVGPVPVSTPPVAIAPAAPLHSTTPAAPVAPHHGLPAQTPPMPSLSPAAPVAPVEAASARADDVPELDFSEPVRLHTPVPTPASVPSGLLGPDDYDPELADFTVMPDITIPGIDDRRATAAPTPVPTPVPVRVPVRVPTPAAAPVPTPTVAQPSQSVPPAPSVPQQPAEPFSSPEPSGGGVFGSAANVDWEANAFSDES